MNQGPLNIGILDSLKVSETIPPSDLELKIMREELDLEGIYTSK